MSDSELKVEKITRGIVIDHIKTGNGLKIFNKLNLGELGKAIALLINVPSSKMGRKDIIKISDVLDLDLTMLVLIDPDITLDYIDEGKVIKKIKLELPNTVRGLLKCRNARCITSAEPYLESIFYLVDSSSRTYCCHYCDEFLKV